MVTSPTLSASNINETHAVRVQDTGCQKGHTMYTDCRSAKNLPTRWGAVRRHGWERSFYGPKPMHHPSACHVRVEGSTAN